MAKTNQEEQRKAPILRFKGFTDDWEQRKLGEIGKIKSCKRIYKNQTHQHEKIPFYKIGTFGKNADSFISENLYKEYRKRFSFPNKGDILISASGTLGKTIVYHGEDAYFQDSNIVWLDNNNKLVLNEYLQNYYQRINWHVSEGSTIKRLYNSDIENSLINFPNINEQIYIFNIFKIINNLISLYVKKSKHIDSYMSYFINVFYNDTEILCKKNHPKMKLKLHEVLIKNKLKNKDLSVSNVESISNKKGFVSQKKQFDNYQVASKDLSNYYVIRPKYFAYNPSRINVGSIAYKKDNEEKSIVSPLYVSFKCNNDLILDKYLWYWFKSSCFNKQRLKLSEGGVRDTLSFNQLSEMIILLPSIEIQEQIINLFDVLSTYKEEIDNKILNLKKIKKELLNDMFL